MDFTAIASEVTTLIQALAPVIRTASPTVGQALDLATSITQAALQGEAAAAALVAQVRAGVPLTPAQIAVADDGFDAALAALDSDIAAADKR